MNFQITNLKHAERVTAVSMPAPVPLMDSLLNASAVIANDVNPSKAGPSRLRQIWPIAAIVVGGLATIAWDGYLLWQVVVASLNLLGVSL
jgi:hypothetical protein